MGFDYEKYQREQIIGLGFDPDKLSDEQKDVMLEPSEAPENYACDGEITPAQALRRWKGKLADSGFTPSEVRILTKKIIG